MNKYYRNVLLVILAFLLAACDGDPSGSKSLEEAKQFLSKGENNAAAIELKNTLQKDGSNREARWLLGKVYFDQGNFVNAIKELNRALELGQPQDDVLPLLSQTYLALNEIQKLQELPVENLTTADSLAISLAAQGLGSLRSGQVDQATSLIERAMAENSKLVYVLLAEARVMGFQSKGEFEPVREKLKKILEKDPEFDLAWGFLGDLEHQSMHFDLAEQAYTNAIKFGKNSLENHYKRALVRLRQANVKGAQEDIDHIDKWVPNHPGSHYLKGMISFQQENFKDAISAFSVSSRVEERYPMSLLLLAMANNLEGNFVQAEDYAYRFLSLMPENMAGRKLLAGLKLKAGESVEAEDLLRPVVESNGDDAGALNLLANALLHQGKREEAIKLLSKIAELQPDSAEARMRLGASLLSSGSGELGLKHIESASELDPQLQQADVLIASAHLRDGDYDSAIKAAEKFAEKNPNSEAPHNLLGQIHMTAGNQSEAKASFSKALKKSAGDLTATQNLAFLAMVAGEADQARSYYLDALTHHKDNLGVLLKLTALEEIEKKPDMMRKYLERAMEAHPDALEPNVLMARYYLTQGRPEQIPILIGELDGKYRNAPDLLNVLGLSQLERSQFVDARGTFKKLSKLRSDAPQPHYHMGKAYLGMGDIAKAKKEFTTAFEISPAYLAPRVELARILLAQRNRDEMIEQLSFMQEIAPENPDVIQLNADRLRMDGNQDEALKLSTLAFEKDPSTRNVLILSRQMMIVGNQAESKNLLKVWINEHSRDLAARLELANLYLLGSDSKAALEQYETVLEADKDNLVSLNNLAWLLRDSDTKRAFEYAEKAVNLSPKSADALDTFAVLLAKKGDFTKAQRMIERALALRPASPDIRYHSAMIAAEVGNAGEALKQLESLLGGDTEFAEKAEAEKLLASLKK